MKRADRRPPSNSGCVGRRSARGGMRCETDCRPACACAAQQLAACWGGPRCAAPESVRPSPGSLPAAPAKDDEKPSRVILYSSIAMLAIRGAARWEAPTCATASSACSFCRRFWVVSAVPSAVRRRSSSAVMVCACLACRALPLLRLLLSSAQHRMHASVFRR